MTRNRLAATLSSGIVLVSLLAGLVILGSPSQERARRIDEQRLADLQQLSRAINAYFSAVERLPNRLEEIIDGRRVSNIPVDPESAEAYPYQVLGTERYRLCATFTRDAEDEYQGDFWMHSAGRQCFDFTAVANR